MAFTIIATYVFMIMITMLAFVIMGEGNNPTARLAALFWPVYFILVIINMLKR